MRLPVELQNKVIDFFKTLPNIDDTKSRQAFIYSASLDLQLEQQIPFDEPPAQFIPHIVSKLLRYGRLEDGRYALEAVLGVTKNYIGQDRQAYCQTLIEQVREKLANEAFESNRHFIYDIPEKPASQPTITLTTEERAEIEQLICGDHLEKALEKLKQIVQDEIITHLVDKLSKINAQLRQGIIGYEDMDRIRNSIIQETLNIVTPNERNEVSLTEDERATIKHFLSEAEESKALETLKDRGIYYNETITLIAVLNRLRNRKRGGLITREQESIGYNKIVLQILELIAP